MATVPVVDRPREKLARVGAEALGDNELIALVLGSGTRSRGALVVAQDVIAAAGEVQGLLRIGLDELCRVPGVGQSRAARLLAAVELGRRTLFGDRGERPQMLSTKDVVDYLAPRYAGFRRRAVWRDAARSEAARDSQRDPVDRHGGSERLASARRVPGGDAGVGLVRGGVSQPPVGRSGAERAGPG